MYPLEVISCANDRKQTILYMTFSVPKEKLFSYHPCNDKELHIDKLCSELPLYIWSECA